MTTATATRLRPLPSPSLYGHPGELVPDGCARIRTDALQVGDVLQHAPATFDLVTSIEPTPSGATRLVHVLRTVPSGRTTTAFFWIGEHARRTVDRVVTVPVDVVATPASGWS